MGYFNQHEEDKFTVSGTYSSDVRTDAQIARNIVLSALLRNAWRRLFSSAPRDDNQPIRNALQDLGA